ncbi:MAG: hypothetical protein QNJ53_19125, partial [Pleurocapsa sp. MO_192.B19]|nr:hypothetical protein [Pleurocapsa sp. MO_192.B19]
WNLYRELVKCHSDIKADRESLKQPALFRLRSPPAVIEQLPILLALTFLTHDLKTPLLGAIANLLDCDRLLV